MLCPIRRNRWQSDGKSGIDFSYECFVQVERIENYIFGVAHLWQSNFINFALPTCKLPKFSTAFTGKIIFVFESRTHLLTIQLPVKICILVTLQLHLYKLLLSTLLISNCSQLVGQCLPEQITTDNTTYSCIQSNDERTIFGCLKYIDVRINGNFNTKTVMSL